MLASSWWMLWCSLKTLASVVHNSIEFGHVFIILITSVNLLLLSRTISASIPTSVSATIRRAALLACSLKTLTPVIHDAIELRHVLLIPISSISLLLFSRAISALAVRVAAWRHLIFSAKVSFISSKHSLSSFWRRLNCILVFNFLCSRLLQYTDVSNTSLEFRIA